MKPIKITVIIIVIGCLFGSGLIIKKIASNPFRDNNINNITVKLNGTKSRPLSQSLNQLAEETQNNSQPSTKDLDNSSQNEISRNLTELVAKSMFAQMQKLDQSETNPFGNFNPENPEIQKQIQEAISNLQNPLSSFDFSIDKNDIKVSQDNSLKNKGGYLEEAGNIILKNMNESYKNPTGAVEKAVMFDNFSELQKLIDTYETIFSSFANLSVPSDWLELHKRYLTLLKKATIVYREIADNIKDDPIKAGLLISQSMLEIIEEETVIKIEYYQLANL
jgi:hypothetical protein